MRFDVNLLVRFAGGEGWVALCDGIGLPVYGNTRQEALDQLTTDLQEILDQEGVAAIRRANRDSDDSEVPCPETTLKLPVDIWYCKVTKEPCPIQGHLDLQGLIESLTNCNAPEKAKEGVARAFETGYPGLHHITGKYRCPSCANKKEHSKNYHYSVSLTLLSEFLDLPGEERAKLREHLLRASLRPSLMYTSVCPDCLIETMEQLGPPYQRDAAVVRLSVEITE